MIGKFLCSLFYPRPNTQQHPVAGFLNCGGTSPGGWAGRLGLLRGYVFLIGSPPLWGFAGPEQTSRLDRRLEPGVLGTCVSRSGMGAVFSRVPGNARLAEATLFEYLQQSLFLRVGNPLCP